MGQCFREDRVEGQSAGWPVQIHSYSVPRVVPKGGECNICAIMTKMCFVLHTPGLVIVSNDNVIGDAAFSFDSFVRHSENNVIS